MALAIETKDTTALSDAELAEMADLAGEGENRFDIGYLSKQREEWVLVTQVRENGTLRGYSFLTLERIGGTPCVLVGLARVERSAKAERVLDGLMHDAYRRALLAFPDEDVLVGTRLIGPEGFRAFKGLADVVPRPGHKATGEERAWGRRLAKRFGAEGRLDDRTFVLAGEGLPASGIDVGAMKTRAHAGSEEALGALFAGLDAKRGDRLVAFGWAMAEDLAAGRLGPGRDRL
jgi:hypothetical protein